MNSYSGVEGAIVLLPNYVKKMLSLGLASGILTGCSLVSPEPPNEITEAYPTNLPRPTVTNFNEAMVCMDNLMVVHRSKPLYLTSQGILNYTSDRSLSSGGKEMLITILGQMSVRSRALRFVAYGSDIRDVLDLQGAHPEKDKFRVPDYFIRGGVTQHNKNLWSGQTGAGASTELGDNKDLTGSYSLLGGYGTVSVDMSAGFIANLQIVPGGVSSNTLALENSEGTAVTADLTLSDFGFSYSLSDNISRDFNDVYRSLIQVSAIELIGKLQAVPYWRCLAHAGDVAERDAFLRQKYNEMVKAGDDSLVTFIKQALKDSDYYHGEVDGKVDLEFREALQSYQQHHNLLATGTVSFDVFRTMNLYTPTRDTPYVMWWESAAPDEQSSPAPFAAGATVPVPLSQ